MTSTVPRITITAGLAHRDPRPGFTRMKARASLDRFVYGRARVECEHCGVALAAHRAVWRGLHPFCSTAHEFEDGT